MYPENLFKKDEKDKVSIEHIYPQNDTDEYWISRFGDYSENERKCLSGSLGNLLPLSLSINIKLQNYSFDDKKYGKDRTRGYVNGSHSEMQVAKEEEWTPEKILDRGLMMIKFMEEQYDFIVPNRADRIKMLGLDFMLTEEDLYQDVTESIQEETESYSNLEDELFLKVDGVTYGIGYYKANKLIVKSGSKIRENIEATDENMREKVKRYRENPKIFEGMYIADEEYSSPSLAANVILGNNKNGWTVWKNKDDVTLDELIRNKTNRE